MSQEAPQAAVSRKQFEDNEAKLRELGGKNIDEMSDDEVAVYLSERKKLKAANETLKDEAHEEALTENESIDVFDQAQQMNRDLDAARAQAEEAKRREVAAAEAAEQAARDQAAADDLERKIKGGEVEGEVRIRADQNVVTQEQPQATSELQAPQTEMFQKYGEKMRALADELLTVRKAEQAKWDEVVAAGGGDKNPKLWKEYLTLGEKRSQLQQGATWGTNVLEFRPQRSGESWQSYSDYQFAERNKYEQTVMQDPQAVLKLAEAGQLGTGYGFGEGIGKVNEKLRSNPEFMKKLLDALPDRTSAESFWPHVSGDARTMDLYQAAVKRNHLNYQFGPKEWKTDPEIKKLALASGLDPMYLEK